MVVHQTVKPAVPRVGIRHLSNLQGHVIPCWGASRVGMITAGWPLRQKNTKIQKNKKKRKKRHVFHVHIMQTVKSSWARAASSWRVREGDVRRRTMQLGCNLPNIRSQEYKRYSGRKFWVGWTGRNVVFFYTAGHAVYLCTRTTALAHSFFYPAITANLQSRVNIPLTANQIIVYSIRLACVFYQQGN